MSQRFEVKGKLPQHVAIIMDGNRRWSRAKRLPIMMGHRQVVQKRAEELIECAGELGIPYITFWAFSTENWKRGEGEVEGLMEIFRWALTHKARVLVERGARVRYIGDLTAFPRDIREDFEQLMEESRDNTKVTVTVALNYGVGMRFFGRSGGLLKKAYKWMKRR